MPFITKTPLKPDDAQKIIHHHFGAHCQISAFTELTDGMFNSAYLIELNDG